MPSRTRGGSERRSPLRAQLKRLLALSLAAPVATAAACRASSGSGAPTLLDASTSPLGDAAPPPASPDASTDASLVDSHADAGPADDANACASVATEAGFFGEDGSCGTFVYLPCGIPAGTVVSGCAPSVDFCAAACPQGEFFICTFPAPTCEDGGVAPDAAIYVDCATCLGNIGRRPVGLAPPGRGGASKRRKGGSQLGQYFAQVAYLEKASVEAFHQLHARLTSFGAPVRLRRAALRAAEDEKRHARVTARIARGYGGAVVAPRACDPARLTLEELALENAVEGCVRETFGALIAMHQAARAPDPGVARAMRRIAEDETRHAELAWAIHRWATARLAGETRKRLRGAQERALVELSSAVGAWGAVVVRGAGLPDGAAEGRMVADFGLALFGAGSPGARRCAGDRARRRAAS